MVEYYRDSANFNVERFVRSLAYVFPSCEALTLHYETRYSVFPLKAYKEACAKHFPKYTEASWLSNNSGDILREDPKRLGRHKDRYKAPRHAYLW